MSAQIPNKPFQSE